MTKGLEFNIISYLFSQINLPYAYFLYIFGNMWPNFKVYDWVMLAPAAGITDSITRKLARRWGADAVVSELISAEGLIRNCQVTRALMQFDEEERPIGIQLFGARPESMAEAAGIAAELKPDFVDLNFGCPAKKVVGKNGGASLLKDLGKLEQIIRQVVKATNLPVTIKYRAGWDEQNIVAVDVARIAEANGASAVCLHPRTRTQGFAGTANWGLIADVKNAVAIPVIGSGDIDSPQKAKQMFEKTGCDAVMICRAAFGNPMIFKHVKYFLHYGEALPEPDIETRIGVALEHLHLSVEKYGPCKGLVRMRSQLCWYLKGLPGTGKIRSALVRLPTEKDVVELLTGYRDELTERGYGSKDNSKAFRRCEIGQNRNR
jgi:tRNA-dihydrouridine synthase B